MALIWDYIFRNKEEPKKAVRKPAGFQRSYYGANQGRLFDDFRASNRSPDSELRPALTTLRNRSRDLARNDPYAKRYFELLRTNVIGDQGFKLQVKARNSDNSLDVIGNEIIERAFADWSRSGNCTTDGKMSWLDVQQYVISSVARDGEAFIQIVKNATFKHGIALYLIEPDLVDETKNELMKNGNRVRMGIEIDQYHRPVAYHVKQYHPGDFDYSSITGNKTVRVPADKMIHVYKVLRAGQTRGEPWMAPVMAQLKMLNAHREAELVASRLAASKMGFFTSQSGDEFPADDYDGTVPIMDAEPGTFHQLPAGVDFKAFNPDHPSTAFADFQKSVLRGIASGLGVSYASLSNDLEGTSYSSVRQGALEERDAYKTMQSFIHDHFIVPVFSKWLSNVMEFNYIPIPESRFDKFFNETYFRGRSWSWVDPQKEIRAVGEAMQLGILSPSEACLMQGRDVEEVYSTWQRDKELADSFGLTTAFEPFGAPDPLKVVEDGSDDQL